jgi:hypothetical protein
MLATAQKQLLELETEVWKARAQAKQKWLERALAEPAGNPGTPNAGQCGLIRR